MKDVLISINPKWVEKIASGEKTIEVRKSVPKLDIPFKCYIYCTIERKNGQPLLVYKDGTICFGDYRNAFCNAKGEVDCYIGEGKVIGEFTCDKIDEYILTLDNGDNYATKDFMFSPLKEACLTQDEIVEYGKGKPLYGWDISKLKIYDKPKDLREFIKSCCTDDTCPYCKSAEYNGYGLCDGRLSRPPQSWRYVLTDI